MAKDVLELLSESDEGVYAVDLNQRIVLWNQGAERILGWKGEEILGRRCYEIIAGRYAERGGSEIAACTDNCLGVQLARRAIVAPSHRVLTHTRTGESKWINITHVLLPSQRWELGVLVHIFQDVTEDVRARETVERLAELLVASPIAKGPKNVVSDQRSVMADHLTPREREVLRLLAQGLGSESIAQQMAVTVTTVRNHVQRILAKLGVHTRLEAVVYASKLGLL